MEQLQSVLLNVWQEACRHIEIGHSTATITALLVKHLPVHQLLVRRIDAARSCLETVAVGLAGSKQPLRDARTNCSATDLQSLLAWCRGGKVSHRRGDDPSAVKPLEIVADHFEGDVLAGPLGDPAGHCGVLALLRPPAASFIPSTSSWPNCSWSLSPRL